MSNYIVIDKETLNALFPEGSELRLKLANDVIKRFTDSFVRTHREEVSEEIKHMLKVELENFRNQLKTMRKEIVNEFIKENTNLSGAELNRFLIEVRQGLNVHYQNTVNDMLQEADKQLTERIRHNIKYMESVANERINTLCKRAGEHMAEKGLARALDEIMERTV